MIDIMSDRSSMKDLTGEGALGAEYEKILHDNYNTLTPVRIRAIK